MGGVARTRWAGISMRGDERCQCRAITKQTEVGRCKLNPRKGAALRSRPSPSRRRPPRTAEHGAARVAPYDATTQTRGRHGSQRPPQGGRQASGRDHGQRSCWCGSFRNASSVDAGEGAVGDGAAGALGSGAPVAGRGTHPMGRHINASGWSAMASAPTIKCAAEPPGASCSVAQHSNKRSSNCASQSSKAAPPMSWARCPQNPSRRVNVYRRM